MGIKAAVRATTAVTALVAGCMWAMPTGAAEPAPAGGTVYVIQGLPDTKVDVSVDGRTVASELDGASVSDPISLSAGRHRLSFSDKGGTLLERSMTIGAGDSTDVVLHLQVDPTADPVVTLFDNSSKAVPADKASVSVTHTAAVPPADIRVDGKVLFANIANGESLDLVVPTGTYSVDIVPAGKKRPVILGPLDLPVQGGSLNRVFAVGDPASNDMRVVVQVLDVADSGSATPSMVDTGTGGQAASTDAVPTLSWYPLAGW